MGIAFHFPLLIIFLPMAAAIIMPLVRDSRKARSITLLTHFVQIILAITLVITLWNSPIWYFTYRMGYFPAPFGNEIGIGMLEALLVCVFSIVMTVCIYGTKKDLEKDIESGKRYFYYCMLNLLSTALMALVFTNDLFTAYVFIEVITIAACSIVVAKENKDTLKATIKYLFLSVMGSGLFLMALAILYSITGHLLMQYAGQSVAFLVANDLFQFPLVVSLLLFVVSIAVKSALFPFHSWLPDAHGSATTTSSAILSGLVLKGYVVFLIKLLHRVYGIEIVSGLGAFPVLFALGVTGIVAGSVMACFQTKFKRLIAYSTVGQIGYIFMGMGLNTTSGFVASSFHIIGHSFTKSMMFIAAGALIAAAGSPNIAELVGAGRRNKIAGIAFTVGALSMAGIPLFAGFVTKFYIAGASMYSEQSIWFVLPVLALSTFLSGVYYFPVLVKIYSKQENVSEPIKPKFSANFVLIFLIAINIALGLFFMPLLRALEIGILSL